MWKFGIDPKTPDNAKEAKMVVWCKKFDKTCHDNGIGFVVKEHIVKKSKGVTCAYIAIENVGAAEAADHAVLVERLNFELKDLRLPTQAEFDDSSQHSEALSGAAGPADQGASASRSNRARHGQRRSTHRRNRHRLHTPKTTSHSSLAGDATVAWHLCSIAVVPFHSRFANQ